MTTPVAVLPSWRPGAARDAILSFLAASAEVPPHERVAVFDNDGTLWCEKPNYVQMEYFLHVLGQAVARDPSVAERAEFAALLSGDRAALAEIGLEHIGFALVGLTEGWTPTEFDRRVREWVATARHRERGVPLHALRYRPMLELIEVLRSVDFDVYLVTGGGTEFVRAISEDLYGVTPEGVVGSQVEYRIERVDGRPELRRTVALFGEVNEGDAKISNIQHQLGRAPIIAGGNSLGDGAMLDFALASGAPSLALLVDHDDAEREYAYASVSGTMDDAEPIVDIGRRSGWTIVSMRDDWSTVFADD